MTDRRIAREPRGIDPESGKQVYGSGRRSWGGPAKEVQEATDEITGKPISSDKVEKVVLEGPGRPGKKPRRTVSLTAENKAHLLKLAGKTEEENPVISEDLLETLKQNLASEKNEN